MSPQDSKTVEISGKREENNKINETQYLSFEIGKEKYALKLIENKEVIEPPPITKVPNTKKYVSGVINLRGQIVPVINLEKKLDITSNDAQRKRIIVVEIKNSLVGILVDDVEDVVNIHQDNIEEITENKGGINQKFIDGVFSYENNLVIIINIKDILFGDEK